MVRGYVEGRVRLARALRARMTPVLSVRGASKRFGAVVGLDGLDVDVSAGEVVALLATTAGKSTLMKCLSGALRLDRGAIEVEGRRAAITPGRRAGLGIETVYQDLALFDDLGPGGN